jgi:hypothetical protein
MHLGQEPLSGGVAGATEAPADETAGEPAVCLAVLPAVLAAAGRFAIWSCGSTLATLSARGGAMRATMDSPNTAPTPINVKSPRPQATTTLVRTGTRASIQSVTQSATCENSPRFWL